MLNEAKKCQICVEIKKPSYDAIASAIKEVGQLGDMKGMLIDLLGFIPDNAKDKIIDRLFIEDSFRKWLCRQVNANVIPKGVEISIVDIHVENMDNDAMEITIEVEGCSYQEIRKVIAHFADKAHDEHLSNLGIPALDILFDIVSDCGVEEWVITRIVDECNPALCKWISELINKELEGKTSLRVSLRNLELFIM